MSKVKDRLADLHAQNPSAPSNETTIDIEENGDIINGVSKKRAKQKIKRENKELKKTLDKALEIREIIVDIEANLKKAIELEEKAENEVFKASGIFNEINELFKENTKNGHKAAKKLKELQSECQTAEEDSSAEARMKHLQFVTLKTQLKEVLVRNAEELDKFRCVQLDNLKAEIQVANATYTDEDLERLLTDHNNPFQVFTDNLLLDTAEAKRQLADIEERHKQLLEIENSIKEVNDLFKHIAVLVEMQQESLNRVEYHAGTTTEYIGAVDLSKVRRSKNRARKRKFCIIGIVIVIIIVIVMAIVF